ncbi:MAG: methyltransferase domain-containing protein [Chloroflexi bacterium]|nr:methyltransferase domain-containing protein [Chloroflexota bacterium]
MSIFYAINNVPVHSVVLLRSRKAALEYPRGDIALAYCRHCSFISNVLYDESTQDYSKDYESTQSYSPTFTKFAKTLAQDLVDRHDLQGKTILEIGCGQGEFLTLLCELGGNRGIGFDPAYNAASRVESSSIEIEFIKDYYSEKYAQIKADFIVCKMTMEHIPEPERFIAMIRASIDEQNNPTLFFQVPDVRRVLKEGAFWDIYYEHCSYFSPVSLQYLFAANGFEILKQWQAYDDQYLLIEVSPHGEPNPAATAIAADLDSVSKMLDIFSQNVSFRINSWKQFVQARLQSGSRLVIWGAGSKAVAFFSTLGLSKEIKYAVDINPIKEGTHLPGSGHKIVNPEFLVEYAPQEIIVMNPIYVEEIERDLRQLGISAELTPIA